MVIYLANVGLKQIYSDRSLSWF